MKIQVIAAIVCLLSFSACNHATKPSKALSSAEILELAGQSPGMNAGNGNFTVKTPAGWSTKDTVISRIAYIFMTAPAAAGSPFQANVNIITQELKEGFTVDKYMATTQKEMQTFFSSYKKLAEGERTVTDVKAKWMKCQYIHRESGTVLNGEITILVKNNIAYAITLTTLADELEQYAPALEEVLGSFNAK
ncbi:hypothetical protein ACDQ55_19945 [Chitinophaga sp. 30R24]|uniref:hypothetical protein n=1 Tax=Chitinophaga sp. 30R24 TaxID=3248838 RepID=UPI003B920DCC